MERPTFGIKQDALFDEQDADYLFYPFGFLADLAGDLDADGRVDFFVDGNAAVSGADYLFQEGVIEVFVYG